MTSTSSPLKNIGPNERRRRLLLGWLLFAFSIGLGAYFCFGGQPTWVRLTIFLPFFFSYLALFQAQSHTCVFHGLKGTCNDDSGTQKLEDPHVRGKLWSRSIWLLIKSAIFALFWTFLVLVLNNQENFFDLLPQQPQPTTIKQ